MKVKNRICPGHRIWLCFISFAFILLSSIELPACAEKDDVDFALVDINQTLLDDPSCTHLYVDRGLLLLAKGNSDAVLKDALHLSVSSNREDERQIGVILGYLAHRMNGDRLAADVLLKSGLERSNGKVWPYAILQCLSGSITDDELLRRARDREQSLQAYTFLGASKFFDGDTLSASLFLVVVPSPCESEDAACRELALSILRKIAKDAKSVAFFDKVKVRTAFPKVQETLREVAAMKARTREKAVLIDTRIAAAKATGITTEKYAELFNAGIAELSQTVGEENEFLAAHNAMLDADILRAALAEAKAAKVDYVVGEQPAGVTAVDLTAGIIQRLASVK